MVNKNLTAVQWLHQIVMNHLSHEKQMQLEGLFQQSERIEKEQIMSAWLAGFEETRPYVDHSEDYYKETYKE